MYWGAFQKAVTGDLRFLLSRCSQDSREAAEVRAAIEKLRDRENPQTRRMFKQWLSVLLHMDTTPMERKKGEQRKGRKPVASR